MATMKIYNCPKCGYEIESTPQGHYSLATGEYYQFNCHNCENIVSLSAKELLDGGFEIKCPECGHSGELYNWNPIDGVCPKCGIPMEEDNTIMVLAD